MPRGIVAGAAEEGRVDLHALPPGDAMVDTVFIRRRDAHATSALSALIDAVSAPPLAAVAE
jgi:hypothetical protein